MAFFIRWTNAATMAHRLSFETWFNPFEDRGFNQLLDIWQSQPPANTYLTTENMLKAIRAHSYSTPRGAWMLEPIISTLKLVVQCSYFCLRLNEHGALDPHQSDIAHPLAFVDRALFILLSPGVCTFETLFRTHNFITMLTNYANTPGVGEADLIWKLMGRVWSHYDILSRIVRSSVYFLARLSSKFDDDSTTRHISLLHELCVNQHAGPHSAKLTYKQIQNTVSLAIMYLTTRLTVARLALLNQRLRYLLRVATNDFDPDTLQFYQDSFARVHNEDPALAGWDPTYLYGVLLLHMWSLTNSALRDRGQIYPEFNNVLNRMGVSPEEFENIIQRVTDFPREWREAGSRYYPFYMIQTSGVLTQFVPESPPPLPYPAPESLVPFDERGHVDLALIDTQPFDVDKFTRRGGTVPPDGINFEDLDQLPPILMIAEGVDSLDDWLSNIIHNTIVSPYYALQLRNVHIFNMYQYLIEDIPGIVMLKFPQFCRQIDTRPYNVVTEQYLLECLMLETEFKLYQMFYYQRVR